MSDNSSDVPRNAAVVSLPHDAVALPRVARQLGWLSIALGIAELCAPRALSRTAGIDARPTTVRLYGLREIVCGIGILTSRQPQRFLWARVAGDLLDIGSATAAAKTGSARAGRRVLAVGTALVGVGALDIYAAGVTASSRTGRHNSVVRPLRDYSTRSGFPQAPDAMRGVALADFQMPRDMRTPEALRPYPTAPDKTGKSAG